LAHTNDLASQLSHILFFVIEIYFFQNFAADIYSPQKFPFHISHCPKAFFSGSMFGVNFLATRWICPFCTGWLNATTSASSHTYEPLTTHDNHNSDDAMNNDVNDDGDGATGNDDDDNGNGATGDNTDDNGDGTTGNKVNNDGNGLAGNDNDDDGNGDCNGASGYNDNGNGYGCRR
jgi:hypothetical protein